MFFFKKNGNFVVIRKKSFLGCHCQLIMCMRIKCLVIFLLLYILSLNAQIGCPVLDFDDVTPFCTEENEYGITYPARTDNIDIPFFLKSDVNGNPIKNTGCLNIVYSPSWYIMQIDHDGSLVLEISHSEQKDVDFACYGPFEGSSKMDVLNKICSDPDTYFYTDLDYVTFCDSFFNAYQWDVVYSEDCNFSDEYRPIYDSILSITKQSDKVSAEYSVRYQEYSNGDIDYETFDECRKSTLTLLTDLSKNLDQYVNVDPRYYDLSSNCFRPDLDPFPNGKMVDCCNSPNAKEVCRIDNAKSGEWYLIILSNYTRTAGNVLFRKLGGEATTNCNIILDASVNSVCEGGVIEFSVNNAPLDATFVWSGPNGFSSTLQSPVIPNASLIHEGTYSVKMTANGKTSPSLNLEVVVNQPVHVDTTIVLEYGDSIYFGGNMLSASGAYTHTFIAENGCDSIVNLTLQVKEINIRTENNGPLCEGDPLVLSAHDIPNSVDFKWVGPNGFSSEDSLVVISNVSAKDSGMYSIEAYRNGRIVDVSSTHVDVSSLDKIELFDVLFDSAYTFNGLVINKAGDYTASLKNANGCDSVVTLHLRWAWDSIQVVPDPYFSPNGDGVRDRWHIEGVDRFPSSVKIYDRHGKMVRMYETYSNEDGWDGKDSKGDDMPSSDYWFVVVNRKIDKVYIGHVSLVR